MIPEVEMTVAKDGRWWTARPKELRDGYIVVTGVCSSVSAEAAAWQLRVALCARGIRGAVWMTPAQLEAAIVARGCKTIGQFTLSL